MSKMYKSCNLIQHGLCFFEKKLVSCCISPVDQINGQIPPFLYDNYKGEILTREDLFFRIKKYSDIFENGGTPEQCKNCFKIEEKEWESGECNKYIDYVTVTHFSKCNADCVYCSNNLTPEERSNNTYEVLPVLKRLKEEGILKEGFELHIGGGEFSIYKECDDIIREFALTKYAKVYIPTNVIKFSKSIFEALNNKSTVIIVSLDSGCKETFAKIKRVNAFEEVVENLKKYSSTEIARNQIVLKYIIIPTINDNINEFKKFLEVAKKCQIESLSIDIDSRYSRMVNHHIDYYYYELAKKMKQIAVDSGRFAYVELYSFLQQDEYLLLQGKNKFFKRIFNRIKTKLNERKLKKLYTLHKY